MHQDQSQGVNRLASGYSAQSFDGFEALLRHFSSVGTLRDESTQVVYSLETSAVAAKLRSLDMFEFYGTVRFDEHGQASSHPLLVLQRLPGSSEQHTQGPGESP